VAAAEADSEGLRAWRAFLEAHASVTRTLDRELQEERGLPLTWYDALVQLEEAGGELRMFTLAERLLLSRSATTRFADRLEGAGLIERRRCDGDRRGTEVSLTAAGRAALHDAAPVHLRGIEEHFSRHLDPAERRLLAAALGRVASVERG
jgi:DNA-binding MarR family transcriptional regulator